MINSKVKQHNSNKFSLFGKTNNCLLPSLWHFIYLVSFLRAACKRKEEQQSQAKSPTAPKKPRLVFTDLQRRTLQAIFKETKRPSKEMQITISQQLGLELSTVGNFFMNARRRSQDKWLDEVVDGGSASCSPASTSSSSHKTVGSSKTPNLQQTSVVTLGATAKI